MVRFAKQFEGHAYSPAGELLCSGRRPAQGLSNYFAFANSKRTRRDDFRKLASATGASTRNFLAKKYPCSENYSGSGAKARTQKGFIALITAIILSVILLVVTIALNQTGFLTRSEILESEYKNRSAALAEGCADMAIIKLALDPAYSGNEASIAVGSDTCAIGTVTQDTPVSGQATIFSNAVFPNPSVTSQGAVTKLQVVINSADLSVISWEELP